MNVCLAYGMVAGWLARFVHGMDRGGIYGSADQKEAEDCISAWY